MRVRTTASLARLRDQCNLRVGWVERSETHIPLPTLPRKRSQAGESREGRSGCRWVSLTLNPSYVLTCRRVSLLNSAAVALSDKDDCRERRAQVLRLRSPPPKAWEHDTAKRS